MVFYFTGTGNSLYVARSLDSECVSIPQIMNRKQRIFQAQQIGIVCPCYGHELPQMVQEFIRRSIFACDYLYVIVTYGFAHGNVVDHVLQVFDGSKKQPDLVRTILMVDNFLPGFDMKEQEAMHKDVEGPLQVIRRQVGEKRHLMEKVTPEDLRIHRAYAESVHHQDARCWANLNFTDLCIGCGLCTKVCPAGCIHLENGKALRTGEGCQACLSCAHVCPEMAIQLLPAYGAAEPNPKARYRNPNVSLSALISSNWQCEDRESAHAEDKTTASA